MAIKDKFIDQSGNGDGMSGEIKSINGHGLSAHGDTLSEAQEGQEDEWQEEVDEDSETHDAKVVEETELETTGTINGHEYVDLGLSVRWATCNVGASSPEGYGDYFAWGETSPKSSYYADDSKTYDKSSYNYDIGENSSLDAARVNWGGTWRLPTKAEMQELIDKCTWSRAFQGRRAGYKVTGPSGRSIFLPAAGDCAGSSLYNAGSLGGYWTSSPDEKRAYSAYELDFRGSLHHVGWGYRYRGLPVRPVSAYRGGTPPRVDIMDNTLPDNTLPDNTINGHTYVDLGLSVKWATCNVGATSPEDYGDYFAWGEMSHKSTYTKGNNETCGEYIDDFGGDPFLDAARARWGGSWRLPTEAEMQELIDKCTWEWITLDGKKGYKVTGPSGRSIFLPAAGYRNGSSLYDAGSESHYWSSTPIVVDADFAYCLHFDDSTLEVEWDTRYNGNSVRPVSE